MDIPCAKPFPVAAYLFFSCRDTRSLAIPFATALPPFFPLQPKHPKDPVILLPRKRYCANLGTIQGQACSPGPFYLMSCLYFSGNHLRISACTSLDCFKCFWKTGANSGLKPNMSRGKSWSLAAYLPQFPLSPNT